ncbi:hypothetical protein V6N12_028965 [Hibiscus sabdariffa]|uniref:Uncharacterized protein n=1 Tax=Hibiscus sabdariffa TaxID=183260 RepID=A0ABR2F7E6_9ROSI
MPTIKYEIGALLKYLMEWPSPPKSAYVIWELMAGNNPYGFDIRITLEKESTSKDAGRTRLCRWAPLFIMSRWIHTCIDPVEEPAPERLLRLAYLPARPRGMETREVNWSGSQMTGPRICDRSEEPLPDTILFPLRTTKKCDSYPAFFQLKKATFVVGVGAGRSGSEAQVVMQMRGERSSPLRHLLVEPSEELVRAGMELPCEFEEEKVNSMEVQQALPPVPKASEPLPLAQEPVSPSFEIQAAEVNQEDIWREFEQQEQPVELS